MSCGRAWGWSWGRWFLFPVSLLFSMSRVLVLLLHQLLLHLLPQLGSNLSLMLLHLLGQLE